jgi:phage tail protein X|tara:strand:- start:803 stop:1012 length:210 start_codon:yes stop_codon:yes gene_type:complete
MSIIYTTRDGDILDRICQNYYGSTTKIVERVLEANPHLSELDAVFDAGVKITLPEITIQKESEIVKLWS